MPAPVRLVSVVLLLGYIVCMVAVLMEYDHTVASGVVNTAEGWLVSVGAPGVITAPGRAEFVLNAAMVAVPVLLASLLLPRHPWANWVVYGFVLSCVVELVQGLYLPPRSAQFEDVVANTLGALLGSVVSRPLTRLLGRRSGHLE